MTLPLTFRLPQASISVTRVDSELQDQAAHDFERLFRDIGPVLWRAIYAYSGGRRVVADDAVAEAFSRALERRDTIRNPVPWLYRTAFRLGRGGDEDRGAPRAPDGGAGSR